MSSFNPSTLKHFLQTFQLQDFAILCTVIVIKQEATHTDSHNCYSAGKRYIGILLSDDLIQYDVTENQTGYTQNQLLYKRTKI